MPITDIFKSKKQIGEDLLIGELSAIKRYAEDNIALLKKHKLQTPITYAEIKQIDDRFARRVHHIEALIGKLDEAVAHAKKDERLDRQIEDDTAYQKKVKKLGEECKQLASRYTFTAIGIEKNFEVFNSEKSRKNLQLSPGTETQGKLLLDLLQRNPGVAVGEMHIKENAAQLIATQMGALKQAGLTTIYTEYPPQQFAQIQRMSLKQLRDFANGKEVDMGAGYEPLRILTRKETAAAYGASVKDCDDPRRTEVAVLLAARENGIRVVNIDSRDVHSNYVDSIDFGTKTRFSHTNFEWSEAIKRDRAQHPEGKYLVYAGANHFGNMDQDLGLVDDALGIPSLAFTQSKTSKGFVRAGKDEGADYWLGGGPHHPDLQAEAHKFTQRTEQALHAPDATKAMQALGLDPNFLHTALKSEPHERR